MTEAISYDPAYRLPPGEPKFRRRSAQRPGEIIAAASILFEQNGVSATTVAMIAAHAGLTRGGVCRYFPTKASLCLALQTAVPSSTGSSH